MKLFEAPVVLLLPVIFPKKLFDNPVVLEPPPPKAKVVIFGIRKLLYKVAAPLSCPAKIIGAELVISLMVILSKLPV